MKQSEERGFSLDAGMKIEELEQIIRILKQNEVNEFEFDNDGVRIRLTRGGQITGSVARNNGNGVIDIEPAIIGSRLNEQADVPSGESSARPEEDTSHLVKVESPIVGTFYRKPSPDSDLFAAEGQVVKKGDTLCIIEAMKLMNEIEAPCAGRIEKICLDDAQVVEFGEVLFLINPNV